MNNELSDDDPRLKSVCKIGEGKQCCRWLARGGRGYFCAKFDAAIAHVIRQRFESGQLEAQGDNCPGLAGPDDDIDAGPCCGCGATGGARNLVMYDFIGPEGFTGWGCVVCDLPPHGAIAVLCDRCVEQQVEPRFICGGKYATEGVRVSLDGYERRPFHHDMSKHPELQFQELDEFEGEEL